MKAYLLVFAVIFLFSCSKNETRTSIEDLGITVEQKENLELLKGEELKEYAGTYVYKDKNPQNNHFLVLTWEEDSLQGEYLGCEMLQDGSTTYYLTQVYNFMVTENGDISFKLKERMLFFEPVKLNQKSFSNRFEYSKSEIQYTGLISGERIELKCKNNQGCCWNETMLFEKDDVNIELSEPTSATSYKKLVETGTYASCVVYELQNGFGEKIKLPEEVEPYLDCPAVLTLSPDYTYLVFLNEKGLQAYSFASQSVKPIVNFKEAVDGISNVVWSPNKEKIAFVEINQQKLDSLTRLHIVDISRGNVSKRMVLDVPVNFECGGICTSNAGEDFKFKNNQTILYKRHWAAEYKPEEEESIELENEKK